MDLKQEQPPLGSRPKILSVYIKLCFSGLSLGFRMFFGFGLVLLGFGFGLILLGFGFGFFQVQDLGVQIFFGSRRFGFFGFFSFSGFGSFVRFNNTKMQHFHAFP
jgi:hypothetical protein